MERRLIVARMDPRDAHSVSEVFAESDAGELPGRIGVTARSLFHFQGLYFHLIESDRPVRERIGAAVTDPLFQDVSRRLEPFVTAYDPQTWQGPADAMATRFYSWRAQ